MSANSLIPRKIWCFWTGRNEMSSARAECLASMRENCGVPVEFMTWRQWLSRILPEDPLHKGFKYLSCIHKSDYLRCYFMHHFGGGYSDIKHIKKENNWRLCFDIMDAFPQIQVIGQPEIMGGSPVNEFSSPESIASLISVCYFVCRPHSEFTTAWYGRMMELMDKFLPVLENHPATDVFGQNEGYPIPWAALLGEPFHRTVMDFRSKNPDAVSSALQSGRDITKPWR